MRKVPLLRLLWVALLMMAIPALSPAQISVGLSIQVGPPALPVYPQPVCPAPGYLWTPGYWAYGPDGYYWVPGTWVAAPTPGFLWTPGYWGWEGGAYIWHGGYWGPHVGFYGGVNYGYGYGGVGFVGGHWDHGVFAYNSAVTNVNVTVIHTTYVDRTVINNVTVNRVSFNGGPGGLVARPTAAEMVAMHDRHIAATAEQVQHEHLASTNRALLASENHGRPAIAATSRPGQFDGHGVMASRAPVPHPPANVPRPPASAQRPEARMNNAAPRNDAAHSDGRYQPVSKDRQGGSENRASQNRGGENRGAGQNRGGENRGGEERHEGGERPH